MPENPHDLFAPVSQSLVPIPAPTKTELPNATKLIAINIDELKPNTVLIVKIDPEGMQQRIAASKQIAMALRPLMEKMREKNISIIVMGTNEGMEVLDEERMGELGWEKKDKSRIITPY